MTLHRFFLPPGTIGPAHVEFPPAAARQIRSVLRLRPGEKVIALDGSGTEYVVQLQNVSGAVSGTIEDRCQNQAEPRTQLVLYQALLKGPRLDLVLQKCTEVGVTAFIPVVTSRSIAVEPHGSKHRRFEAIVREAAEQSGRGKIPDVSRTLPFSVALRQAADGGPVILPWEEETGLHLADVTLSRGQRVGLFIGPEGGFTGDEVDEARAAGAHIVTLGRRILRAETAAVVTSALLLARVEDLG